METICDIAKKHKEYLKGNPNFCDQLSELYGTVFTKVIFYFQLLIEEMYCSRNLV